jgi:flagellar basal body-associated protein FliL
MTDIPGNQPPQGYPPQPYPPAQYPPPYPPVAYPPPKKGPSALKIVLIVVAIFVGLGIIAVGVVGYGVYRLAKSGNITTSTQPVTASDMGVALYPGAQQKANVRMTVLGKSVLTATFLSSDSKEQVIAFYQNALGPHAQVQSIFNETQFTLNTGAGGAVTVKISSGMGLESGKTQIVIAHATEAATPSQ